MKMSRVFLVLGFVLIMALYSDAMPPVIMDIVQTEPCCVNFFTGKIPPEKKLLITKTGSHCARQGYIVTTPKFKSLCVHEVVINNPTTP